MRDTSPAFRVLSDVVSAISSGVPRVRVPPTGTKSEVRSLKCEVRTSDFAPPWPVGGYPQWTTIAAFLSVTPVTKPAATLKSLHTYLKLLENASELKRRMPASSNQRSLRDGLSEISKLVGIDNAVFKDPQNIAAFIGQQRFVMIWGEPSVTTHIARIFDSSKILLTVLIDAGHFERAAAATQPGPQSGTAHYQTEAKTLTPSWAQPRAESRGASAPPGAEQETPLESLKPLLEGNRTLTCRLFRVLFEHMLGFASQSSAQQGSAALVNELTGSKEHGRSFFATVMFILGAEIDRENVMAFMLAQGLFGLPIFEQLLLNRDYCDANYTFRKLERAFVGTSNDEEAQLRARVGKFNIQFGGKPYGAKLFEAEGHDKARVDAHLAAFDLIEALALTPWSMSLSNSLAVDSSNSVRSLKIVARHFKRFGDGEETKEQANKEIADHLLAFARQYSADTPKEAVPESTDP
jgi:hypothetical protein